MTETVPTTEHDVVAIGCGPFNLGLAALASTVDDVDLVVLEEEPELTWHRGMMLRDASMQVNFLADLVTLVAPSHPLSFLAYLHDMDRLYTFTVRENFFPSRREYEDYLRWAAAKLPSVRFSHRAEEVRWDAADGRFTVDVVRGDGTRLRVRARDLVVGIGTAPYVPDALAALPEARLLHTSAYLYRTSDVAAADKVTVVGSGQSGAEVVVDLLGRNTDGGPAVSWLTRTPSFAPLDYTKMNLELTTPAYMRYFHSLPQDVRDRLVKEQWQFYKGISTDTLEEIHELLYQRQLEHGPAEVELRFGITVESSAVDPATGRVVLTCRHRDTGEAFEHTTDLVVAATGYRNRTPAFLEPVDGLLARDARGRPRVRADHSVELADGVTGRVFVANAEIHSHGVSAPNLDIGAVRNATILNAVTGREAYRLPKRSAFTSFDVPGRL
ncbi:lysine N(6)-hydroxylase/L-ornithine N(5)-oxygenase family protein [Streptomyces ficellus]|uniref:L-lysine N6-monooxygenase MbtG n=1 Tax=Streptomyces ficellus TaxID=1977088 RepID=A0A1W5T3R9_9ACTN|nr:SidA/IucD/PvdA family monooxygenase [Streptomyces ficellus]ARF06241.1 siderophore biosynthesis protein, monooxygenase [Streptomyces ficellus]QGV77889.1 lysine 6-monooxygenase [Streptomyces ficellus]